MRYMMIPVGDQHVLTPVVGEVMGKTAQSPPPPDPNSVFDPLLAFRPRPAPAEKAVRGEDPNGVMDSVFTPATVFFAPRR